MSRKNDYVFKRIFGDPRNKSILISFLNAVLVETIVDVEIMNPELKREHIEDKLGILDIKVTTDRGIYVDVEIQVNYSVAMPKRTLYYWSKVYVEQLAMGSSFSKLMKTVTINIVDYRCFSNDKIHNCFILKERETDEIFTDLMEVHFLELPKIVADEAKAIPDDTLAQWLIFLETKDKEVLEVLSKKNKEIEKAYSIVETMSKSKEERYVYEARQAMIHDIATLEEEKYEEGLKVGREEGREEGIEQGREVGRKEGERLKALEIARKVKQKGILNSAEIAELLGLTSDEVDTLE